MKKPQALFCSVSFSVLASLSAFSQTLAVGTPVLEERWRREQVMGRRDPNISFNIRPLYGKNNWLEDSSLNLPKSSPAKSFSKGRGELQWLPLTLVQQYNGHHPYGWNDGAMIQAKGYQVLASAGIYARIGPLSVQLQPEFVYAQNRDFSTMPASYSDSIWKAYYRVLNRIDAPEKYGDRSYVRLFPGQSSIRINHKKLSLGISTENLWWGPGIRNSLVMSNNAPGFGHLSFNTTAPVKTGVGSFEWQVIAGYLEGSGILPPDTARTFGGQQLYDPKPGGSRYINGMIFNWQPKWTRGLHLGFSRVFYQYRANVPSSFDGYFPVLGSVFKKNSNDENSFGRDQMLSLFFRLVLPESKAEVYGEFGRNDHSQDLRDFLLEPDHARAYIMGLRKFFDRSKNRELEFLMEFTHLQVPPTTMLRAQEGWYTHYQVRHGYTHRGQVIGAGIGPGGSSQILGLNWINGNEKAGATLERVVRNNDFYYEAFAPRQDIKRHWVDMSLNLNKSWPRGRMLYDARLSFVRSLNYQWSSEDATYISARLALMYMF